VEKAHSLAQESRDGSATGWEGSRFGGPRKFSPNLVQKRLPRQLGSIDDDHLERVDYYGNPVQEEGDREALSKPEIAQG